MKKETTLSSLDDPSCSDQYRVYLMATHASGESRYFKIGISKSPYKRKAQLQTGCPIPIAMCTCINVKTMMTARKVESFLHRVFEHAKETGEWFSCPAAIEELAWYWHVFKDCASIIESDTYEIAF